MKNKTEKIRNISSKTWWPFLRLP